MLKQRVLTSVVLIPLVLVGIFYLPILWFSSLTMCILLIAAWEWAALIGLSKILFKILYLLILLIACIILQRFSSILILGLGVITWVIVLYFLFQPKNFHRVWSSALFIRAGIGIWLLFLTWYGLISIRAQPMGFYYLLVLLLWVWGADTGAYFTGRRFGKHKLASHISPGKTIEGVLGGVALVILVAAILGILFSFDAIHYFSWILFALIISVISVVGDLFESMVKRQAGVKDSGGWLPGHGGLLDRIDSLMSAAPIYAGGLWLFVPT